MHMFKASIFAAEKNEISIYSDRSFDEKVSTIMKKKRTLAGPSLYKKECFQEK